MHIGPTSAVNIPFRLVFGDARTETEISGYSDSEMILRRLKLVISCLLAVLLVGGTILPSPALWQCRHSSRLVSAAFAAAPSAMPCVMDRSAMNGPMAFMPCCHPLKPAAERSPQGKQIFKQIFKQVFSPPTCHPSLTPFAAVPAPGMTEAGSSLRHTLAAMQAVLPAPSAFAVSAPLTLPARQRPPPTVSAFPAAPAYSFGLRAPPLA